MSDRLAISAAFSVLLMASYVLFGGDAVQLRLDSPAAQGSQVASSLALPQVLFQR